MTTIVTETFFLPNEVERKPRLVPADIYNLYHSWNMRCERGHVIVWYYVLVDFFYDLWYFLQLGNGRIITAPQVA